MHAERLLWSIHVKSLVLIAQAVFLLEREHTDKQTNTQTRQNAIPMPVAMPAWVKIFICTFVYRLYNKLYT